MAQIFTIGPNRPPSSPIIVRREVFDPSWLPPSLPGREDLVSYLASLLEDPRDVTAVTGAAGSGKTATIRSIFGREELRPNYLTYYIDCSRANTAYRAMYYLVRFAGVLVPPSGYPFDVFAARFAEARPPDLGLVVLDQAEHIKDRGLPRILEVLRETGVPVLVSGRENGFEADVSVALPPYSARELYNILLQRARLGLREGSWDDDALRLVAETTTREGGDARRAIDLLGKAAEIAEREGAPRVTTDHAERAIKFVDEEEVTYRIRLLPFHHRLILLAAAELTIEGEERVTTGLVFRRYAEHARRHSLKPLTMRRVSGVLRELEAQGLMELEMSYGGARGNTKVVKGFPIQPERIVAVVRGE